MKKEEITIGETYLAKVSDKVVPVRIESENPHGGWNAINQSTNKQVRIKSAQRLRSKTISDSGGSGTSGGRDAKKRAKAVAEAQAADAAANAHAVDSNWVPPADAEVKTTKGTKTKTPKAPKAPKADKPKKISGLDAAAQVLADAGEPMNCKDMVDKMLSTGLWKTGGQTPASTIYAAICREIQTKGSDSRFKKTDRGHFTINTK